jgi:tripartite-type tricarboxylate transporter receptor subunit TctC
MRTPEVGAKLGIQGLRSVGTCGADFRAFLQKQYDEYGDIIHEANLKAE